MTAMDDARTIGRAAWQSSHAKDFGPDFAPDLGLFSALLRDLARLRPPDGPAPSAAQLLRGWRQRRLAARLERDWPGGFVQHRNGDLVYVPCPLDRRGCEALFAPPSAHPAALAQLRPGAVAIESDAGLGSWAVPLARAVTASGRLLAIEPMPRHAAALAKTFAANALRQAEAVRCALGAADGTAGSAVSVVTGDGEESCGVALRSLDSLVGEYRLHRLDLLKIAALGEERRVLDGAADLLERFRPVLVLATGYEAEGERAAIHYRLRGLGYRIAGILLEGGMAEASWAAYTAAAPPFRPGDPRDLLLVPEPG
jgi:FkbM family methyltransferase